MKKLIFSFLFIFITSFVLAKDEGHPHWWWSCKDADVIAKGIIKYKAENNFEIDTSRVTGEKHSKQLYILGKIKISEIIFINKQSGMKDAYDYLGRNLNEEHDIIFPARRDYYLGMRTRPLRPGEVNYTIVPDDIFVTIKDNEEVIVTMNKIYLYPLYYLVIDAVVPKGQEKEVRAIVTERLAPK